MQTAAKKAPLRNPFLDDEEAARLAKIAFGNPYFKPDKRGGPPPPIPPGIDEPAERMPDEGYERLLSELSWVKVSCLAAACVPFLGSPIACPMAVSMISLNC